MEGEKAIGKYDNVEDIIYESQGEEAEEKYEKGIQVPAYYILYIPVYYSCSMTLIFYMQHSIKHHKLKEMAKKLQLNENIGYLAY